MGSNPAIPISVQLQPFDRKIERLFLFSESANQHTPRPSQIHPGPPGNRRQPPSSNVDRAQHQPPREAALNALASLVRSWHHRCLPRVPPLPRESPRQTRTPTSRGRGGGGGTTSCRRVAGIRTPSTTRPKPRRTASTWSTARPPSSHAVRASAQSERPRSRTDRRPRGSNVVTFDRVQITREP